MHVGMGVIFQGQGEGRTDRNVYRNELRLGDLAEPLGFESLWGVEHHFTDYTMCPDVLLYLAHMAGRTQRIQLGSMVVVLPWHDPVRVAEQVIMLDHMSNGRYILGLGRGLGRVEFEGFGVKQEESRARFVEASQIILEGLDRGYVEFEGKYYKQTRRELRPRPFKSFRGRTYAAAVSPESSVIMAKLGIGLLIIPQKPWDQVLQELGDYRRIYTEVNGTDAPPPIVAGWTFCDENADRAAELGRKYIAEYWRSVVRHYELVGDHLTKMKGYEAYKDMQERASAPGGVDQMVEFFLSLQVYGTPEQCYEKIIDTQRRTGSEAFVGVFSYGGMPYDVAEHSLRTFSNEVIPELRRVVPVEDQLIARAGVGERADASAFRLMVVAT
jgi:alkanesulfonate monooxygenase SsuD/methylene tetrahydromethanopterin reductase-like flavin-dependent oxidoreductase (luciferase family)